MSTIIVSKNTAKQAQTALLSECTATFPMFSFLSITCKKAIPFLQKKKSEHNLLFLYLFKNNNCSLKRKNPTLIKNFGTISNISTGPSICTSETPSADSTLKNDESIADSTANEPSGLNCLKCTTGLHSPASGNSFTNQSISLGPRERPRKRKVPLFR